MKKKVKAMTKPCPTPSSLPDEKLLEMFLPPPAVRELIEGYGTAQQALNEALPGEIQRLPGVGKAKAQLFLCARELARRLYASSNELPPVIRTPQDVFSRFSHWKSLGQEQMAAIYLTTKNGILAERVISQGTLNMTVADPRSVFEWAIRLRAASVILVHNHPSGDCTPSPEDVVMTKKMVEAGNVLGIPVLDHCIIGKSQYVSLKEKGMM